jgi:hypothetical protein
LWRFAHPHFCVCVKPLRSFFQRKRKNVANLLSLYAICFEIGWENTIKKEIMEYKRYCNFLLKTVLWVKRL